MSDRLTAEKAAKEVRGVLLDVDNPSEYNQGVDDAVEAMKQRWVVVEERDH